MIKPINGHVLIEPLKHETFMASQRDTFEEVGIVISIPNIITNAYDEEKPNVGDKAFFDSWLAVKYPKSDGEFFWLVKYDDIRAIERNGDKVSK